MNERIRELRKYLGLTMEKFGEMVGIKKASISLIENGRNNLSDRLINNICKTSFNGNFVNEEWLRTGSGPMFVEMTRNQIIMAYAAEIMKDDPTSIRRAFIEALPLIPPEGWPWIKKFCQEILARCEESGDDDVPAALDQ